MIWRWFRRHQPKKPCVSSLYSFSSHHQWWGRQLQSHQRTFAGSSLLCCVKSLQCRGWRGKEPELFPAGPLYYRQPSLIYYAVVVDHPQCLMWFVFLRCFCAQHCGYLIWCHLPASLNQSDYSPLLSFSCPIKPLLSGCFLFVCLIFAVFSILCALETVMCENARKAAVSKIPKPQPLTSATSAK